MNNGVPMQDLALSALAQMGTRQLYSRQARIVTEGELGQALFVVLSGRIRIYTENQSERRFVIGTFGPGTLFGEGSLDGGPRTASVEAITDVICVMVPYADLKRRMTEDTSFALALIAELIARSRVSARRMKSLALDSVYQRLRALMEAESTPEDGVMTLNPDLTQVEMANRLGASRDMITKVFRELSKGGYIRTTPGKGKTLILKDLPKAW